MRWAGVAHSGQGARVCVDCTRRVSCAVVSSTSHASRRRSVASGNKRGRTVVAGVETKAGSFFHEYGLWSHGASVSPHKASGLSCKGMKIYKVESRRMPRYFRVSYHQNGARTHLILKMTVGYLPLLLQFLFAPRERTPAPVPA